jgi:uncharacterized protein (TIGR03435 family)
MRMCIVLTLLAAAHGQTFEVASIKPSPPTNGPRIAVSRGGPRTKDPGLYTCENCGAAMLIRQAFDLKDYQLSDQVWMQSTRFNVAATIPEGATIEQFQLMLRNLLTERLKLKFHYEKKEVLAYELAVMKNGPKMKESSGVPGRDDTPAPPTGEFKTDAEGFPILPVGRELALVRAPDGRAAMSEAAATMEELAKILAAQVDRPVTDATELKGEIRFHAALEIRYYGRRRYRPHHFPGAARATRPQAGVEKNCGGCSGDRPH